MAVTGAGEAREKALQAKAASGPLGTTSQEARNKALSAMAAALEEHTPEILAANAKDMEAARELGTPAPLLDRLMLDEKRVHGMADGLRALVELPDPLGEVIESRTLYNGIELKKVRVPIGVIAIVYEARPNVTSDAAGICLKCGNACVLRGGSLACNSGKAIAGVLSDAAISAGMPKGCIRYIEDTSHDATDALMSLVGIVDVLIPRGGAGLIKHCVANAKVPVIETGLGNCHIYLHESADVDKAVPIVINAKCQRPGVCNAAESILVDAAAAEELLPPVLCALSDNGVKLHCDPASLEIAKKCGVKDAVPANEDDWGREYLDLEMSVKCVSGLDEAIAHINRYGTHHSESIIARDEAACEKFLSCVDAAAVYSNASTRFTDGGEFGLGAEIGISTQKLHARGPMGLVELCSYKYVLRGDGQVRG